MKTIFLLATILVSSLSYAQEKYLLTDGHYHNGDRAYCAFKILNDLPSDQIVMTATSSPMRECGDKGVVFVAYRESSFEFAVGYKNWQYQTVTAQDVIDCAPRADGSFPCHAVLYKDGQLIATEGDVYDSRGYLKIMNPNAFFTQQRARLLRQGAVISQVLGESHIFERYDVK